MFWELRVFVFVLLWKFGNHTCCSWQRDKIVFQTLTGKEIEIDIEPTDKVKFHLIASEDGMDCVTLNDGIQSPCLHVNKGGAD